MESTSLIDIFRERYKRLFNVTDALDAVFERAFRGFYEESFESVVPFKPKVDGAVKTKLNMAKIAGEARTLLIAGGKKDHLLPFLTRLYNYFGCKTFNVFHNRSDEFIEYRVNSNSTVFAMEDLLYTNPNLFQINIDEEDYLFRFAILNNPTLRRQLNYRAVFSGLMGEPDNSFRNMMFDSEDLYHIDLSCIESYNCSSNLSPFYYEDDLGMQYLFANNYPIILENTPQFNLFKVILKGVNDDFLRQFNKISGEMGIDSNTNIVEVETRLNKLLASPKSEEKKILCIGLLGFIAGYKDLNLENSTLQEYFSYKNNDANITIETRRMVSEIQDGCIDVLKSFIGLKKDEFDFLSYRSEQYRYSDVIDENEKTSFGNKIMEKQLEMFYYAQKYGLLHRVLDVEQSKEIELRQIFKLPDLTGKVIEDEFDDWYNIKNDKALMEHVIESHSRFIQYQAKLQSSIRSIEL